MREYHFLQALSRDAEVDYSYFADPGSNPSSNDELNSCRSVTSFPKPPTYTIRQTLAGILGEWPLPIINYSCPRMMQFVQELTATNEYDLIHVDGIHMLRYAVDLPVPVAYNWHNIESEAIRRYAKTTRIGARSSYARITAYKMQRLERRILSVGFGHIVCSERERVKLSSIEPAARIAVVENGVDTKFFESLRESIPHEFKILVFVGTMDYYPNVDAAVHFATKIWPLLHSQIRDLRFVIVGANPGREVQGLSQIPGITVTGTVPDVRPYYRDALAAIVPLRTGGGTRLKILEAMAAGVPVISTPLGAEGLAVKADTNILMADAGIVDSWFSQISRLSKMRELRLLLSSNARELVRERYDWGVLGRKLSETYTSWHNEKAASSAFR